MNNKLVQLDLPNDGQYKNDLYEKCNQSLQLVTDVGLVLSPCSKYIAWWNRDLLLIYDGSNLLMAKKGFHISFLLWNENADGRRILIICKTLDEDGNNPVFLFDFKTGEIKAEGELKIDSEIIGCFWLGNEQEEHIVSIISKDCVVTLAKIYDSTIFAFTTLSFSNTYKSITSCLTIADNIYIFGTSKTNNQSLMTIWKSSVKSPHFLSNERSVSSSPETISNGMFNRFWRIVFGKPIIGIAEDAVLKSYRFINGFATLSKNGFLSYFSSQNELKWSRNVRKRFNLETLDEITDVSLWNEDSFIISTTSGKIFRDCLSNSSKEPFLYQFSLKTIYAIVAICNDRIYIHDHFLKVLLEYNPEEMLKSHMINHQYEEAYEMAIKFNLNTDDVMKAKWEDSIELNNWDVSILDRIKDRKWVLEKCINPPFPDSYILIKKMINYGLSLSNHISAKAIEDELERMFEKLESPSSTPSTQGSISVMEFYMYRVQFLRRLDLLCTFEAIHMNETLKNDSGLGLGKRFADFLKTNLVDFAISQADTGSLSNLEILFTRHGSKLLPYRLSLLQRLPLTISPFDLEAILPSLQKWYEIPWRKSDWAEAKDLMEFVSLIQEDEMNIRLERTSYPASLEETKEWYIKRIDRIIDETGQIAFARSLCEIASSKGIDLGGLTLNLGLLECARKNIEYQAISLTDLYKISPEKILHLVISSCDLENTPFLLSNVLYPYLITSNSLSTYVEELQEGLLGLCSKDLKFLHLILSVGFTNSSLIDFLSIPFLIQECAYREDIMFDLDFWQQVVYDFEKHKYETSTTSEGWGDEDWSLEVEDRPSGLDNFKEILQDLSDYVNIAVFLKSHGIFWNLSQIQRLKTENSRPLLSKILRQSKLLPNANDQTWNDSLHSILHFVRQGLFHQVSENSVYTEYVVYAFSQAKFQFVQQLFFPKSGVCPLSSENIELLSLNAAVEYFDNDQEGDRSKGLMKLSRTCCTLLKPTIKSIKNHLDLIDATDILIGQYHIMNDAYTNVLPIQIRLHKDRIQFLKMLLQKNPELYRKKDFLFDLLKKLIGDVDAITLRSRYLFDIYSAQAALQLNSFEDCFIILTEISEKSLNPDSLQADELEMFWTVVEKLVSSSYNNLEGKLVLISSAVTKSSASNVAALLPVWRKTYVMSKFQAYPDFAGKSPIEVYTLLQEKLNMFGSTDHQVDFSGNLKRNHDFYQPVGSFIGDFYSEKTGKELDGSFDASGLLHLISLTDQLEESWECDLKALFQTLLAEDISLAFSHMMSSRLDAEELTAIFDELTANSTIYSLAAYFFSLKACLLIPRESFNADPFSLSFNELPEVILSVMDTIPQDTNEFKEISRLIHAAKLFSEKIKSSKVSRLREILVSLLDADPDRVQTDKDYRFEKIIELGKTNVWKTLERAVELAKEEGVPLSKIWVAHALWLFSSDNNGPEINYQDSKMAILSHFSAFEPHLSSVHSDLIESGSVHLPRFYSLLQEALVERKLHAQYSPDSSQLTIRLEILSGLESRGIRNHIMMKQLLESKASGLDGYMKIWIDFGDYIGYQSFMSMLDKWTLLAPIHFLDESFANEQQDNIEFKSQVISKCVLYCISHQPWDSLDLFSINSILEDAFQTFSSMIPQHVEELVLAILSETKFEIKTRELILSHAFPFAIHSERLEQQRDLVQLVINLQHARDSFGNQIPKNVIDMIDYSFCKDTEILKNNLMELCLSDFSPKLMETICTEANLNCLEIYDNAIQKSLLVENRIGIEILLLALKPFEAQDDFGFENNDSWGIDDEFVLEGEIDQFIIDLKTVIFEKLERFSLQEAASHSFKIEILHLLEKYYATKGNDISHLQDAKLESMILSNWDIKIEDRSLSSLFPLVLNDTSTPIQSLQLFELLRDWPEPVENEVWIKAFTKLYELGYIDLILALQAFSRVGSNEIEVEVQKQVLELLSTKQPFSNHYFLYGLLSSQRKIQNQVLNNFDQIHPNHNSYQTTYRVACCLGFLTILSNSHQEECIQSVLQFQEDPLSLPLLGIILSEYPGTTIPICRSWTGMSKGVLKGYNRWIGLEGKLIKESLTFWDSSISSSIDCINQPRDSICHSVAMRQLDQDKLFTLIVADRLGQAKKRIAEYQHEYY